MTRWTLIASLVQLLIWDLSWDNGLVDRLGPSPKYLRAKSFQWLYDCHVVQPVLSGNQKCHGSHIKTYTNSFLYFIRWRTFCQEKEKSWQMGGWWEPNWYGWASFCICRWIHCSAEYGSTTDAWRKVHGNKRKTTDDRCIIFFFCNWLNWLIIFHLKIY